jgi:hypothetical protein
MFCLITRPSLSSVIVSVISILIFRLITRPSLSSVIVSVISILIFLPRYCVLDVSPSHAIVFSIEYEE